LKRARLSTVIAGILLEELEEKQGNPARAGKSERRF